VTLRLSGCRDKHPGEVVPRGLFDGRKQFAQLAAALTRVHLQRAYDVVREEARSRR